MTVEAPSPPQRTAGLGGAVALVAAVVLLGTVVGVEIWATGIGGLGGGRYPLLFGLLGWELLVVLAWLALRQVGRRTATVLVLVGAVALPVGALSRPIQISDDVFRYAWDGRIQAAGTDPYRYPPSAPELRGFRDPWLWPDDATCATIDRPQRPCTRINRLDVRTIYPPVAEAWFTVMHVLPGPDEDRHQRFYASLLSVALALLLLAVLPRLGRDPRLAVLYAWSPVAGFDIAGDGHVDVLAGLFAVGAVTLATLRSGDAPGTGTGAQDRARNVASALLAGAAVAVKLYPGLLLPALVRPVRSRRRLAAAAGFVAIALGFVLATYLPHVLAVGPNVLGYLPGYLQEEQYGGDATRYLLLATLHLPPRATQVLAGVVLAAASAWALTSNAEVAVRAVTLTGIAFLVATPVQPWYGLLLIVLAVLAARPAWLAVAVAAYPAYFSVLLRDPHFLGIGQLGYGVAALIVLLAVLRRRHLGWLPDAGVTRVTTRQPNDPVPAKFSVSTAAQHRSLSDTNQT